MPNNSEIEIRSEEVQEILSYVPNWMIRWGNTLFLLLIVVLLFISWFVKYPDVVTAETTLTTVIPPQQEFARVTGKIDTLFVKDNQDVQPGTALAILENTANFTDVFLLKSIVDTININKKSFVFPLEEVPILFLGDIESSYDSFINSYIKYLIYKDFDPFSIDEESNNVTTKESTLRLRNLISQRELNKKELEFKQKDLQRTQSLFDKGVVSERELELKKLEYLQSERNYKSISSSISQLREAKSNASIGFKGKQIAEVQEGMTLLRNVIQSFNILKKSIKDWEMKYLLQSRIEGRVSFQNFWRENQNVNQGDLLFTILPDAASDYVGILKTPSQNFGKVKVGQKVNISLFNYPEYEYGVLKGEIQSFSETSDAQGFYLTKVKLPEKLISSYNKKIDFKHNMRGTAEIITDDLRLIERFFHHFKNIFNRDE